MVSMPPGVWRDFLNVGESEACALMVCNSQERPRVLWDGALERTAAESGWSRDASGYLAPATLVARRIGSSAMSSPSARSVAPREAPMVSLQQSQQEGRQ